MCWYMRVEIAHIHALDSLAFVCICMYIVLARQLHWPLYHYVWGVLSMTPTSRTPNRKDVRKRATESVIIERKKLCEFFFAMHIHSSLFFVRVRYIFFVLQLQRIVSLPWSEKKSLRNSLHSRKWKEKKNLTRRITRHFALSLCFSPSFPCQLSMFLFDLVPRDSWPIRNGTKRIRRIKTNDQRTTSPQTVAHYSQTPIIIMRIITIEWKHPSEFGLRAKKWKKTKHKGKSLWIFFNLIFRFSSSLHDFK